MFLKNSVRIASLILALCMIIGCERAKEIKVDPPGFRLIAPTATVTEIKDDTNVAIAFTGLINTSAIQVFLNGADVTAFMNVSPTATYALLKDLPGVQPGVNDIRVVDNANKISETFSFTIDSDLPAITITNVLRGGSVPPGNILVTGEIIDASAVSSLVFTDVNGSKSATIQGTPPNQEFSVTLVDNDRSSTNWVTTSPDISYVLTDENGQSVSRSFVSENSRFNNAIDGFISYSLFDFGEFLLSKASHVAISALNSDAVGNSRDVFKRASPSGSFDHPNADPNPPFDSNSQLQIGTEIDFSNCALQATQNYCPSDLSTYGFNKMEPLGSGYCSSSIFDSTKVDVCALYITKVYITPPIFDSKWENDKYITQLNASATFPYSSLQFRVLGLKDITGSGPIDQRKYTYQGKFKTSVEFDDFKFQVPIRLTQGNASDSLLAVYVPEPDVEPLGLAESGGALLLNTPSNYDFSVTRNSASFSISVPITTVSDICGVGANSPCAGQTLEQIKLIAAKEIRKKLIDQAVFVAGVTSAVGFEGIISEGDAVTIDSTSSNLEFSKRESGEVFKLSRAGSVIIDGNKNKRPRLYQSSCDICKIGPGRINIDVEWIEFFYNFGFMKKLGRNFTAMIEDRAEEMIADFLDAGLVDLQRVLNEMAFGRASVPPAVADRKIQFDLYADNLQPLRSIFLYIMGPRFTLNGKVSVPESAVIATKQVGLGSLFVPQVAHSEALYYDKVTGNKVHTEFTFSLSSNIINQYFLAAHKSGLIDQFVINTDSSRFLSTSSINVQPNIDFRISFSTLNTPTVDLIPFRNGISYGGCVMIQGMGNCGSSKQKIVQKEIKPQIMVHFPKLKIIIDNVTSGTQLLEATIDLTLYALVNGVKLTPRSGGDGVFAKAKVLSLDAVDPIAFGGVADEYRNAQASILLSDLFNNLGDATDNLLGLQKVTKPAERVFLDTRLRDLLSSPGNSVFPLEMAIDLEALNIDSGGDYVNVAGHLKYQTLTGGMCDNVSPSTPDYLMTVCVE